MFGPATASSHLVTPLCRPSGKGMRVYVYFARFAVGLVPVALLLACRSFIRRTTAMTIAMYVAVVLLVLLDAFSQSKKLVADPDVENAVPGPRPPGGPPHALRVRRTSAIAAGL